MASLTLMAIMVVVLVRLLPNRLAAATDLIGNPTYIDFDIYRYHAAYLILLTAGTVMAAALVWSGRRLWRTSSARPVLVLPAMTRAAMASPMADTSALMALVVAAAAIGLRLDLASTLGATVLAIGAAIALARRTAEVATRLVAWLAPLGWGVLALASSITVVSVVETGETVAWPWFPVWLAAGLALGLWGVTWRLGAARAARPVAMLGLGLPALWLSVVELPGALGPMDLFHEGEVLVPAEAVRQGAVPWADLHMIHGPWYDVGRAVVGFAVFEPTRWGAAAGVYAILNPLYLALTAALLAWLTGWRWLATALAVLLLIVLDPFVHIRLIAWPPLLAAFALLLVKPSWPRALTVVVIGGGFAIAVPEAAFAAIAVGLAILAHDLVTPAETTVARFRRTLLCAACSGPVMGVLVALLVVGGAWDGFLHHVAVFSRDHALAGGLPVGGDLRVLTMSAVVLASAAAVLVGIGWTVVLRRQPDTREWVLIAATLFVALYFQKVINRADAHVFHVVGAAGVVIGMVSVRLLSLVEASAPMPRRIPSWATVLAVLVMAIVGPVLLATTKDDMAARWRYGGPTLNPETVVKRLRPSVDEAPTEPRLGYARANVLPPGLVAGWRAELDTWAPGGGPILDITNRPALFHYLIDRPPIGRFFHVSLTLRRESQQEMIADLRRVKPAVAILPTARGWDGIPDTLRHHRLTRAILADYVPVAARPDGVIYIPRPAAERAVRRLYMAGVACDWGYAAGFLDDPVGVTTPWPGRLEPPLTVVRFEGWAASPATGRAAERVYALLDDRILAEVTPDHPRPDVAAALNSPDAAVSGFALAYVVASTDADRVRLVARGDDGTARSLAASPELVPPDDNPDPRDQGGWIDRRSITHYSELRRLEESPIGVDLRALRLVIDGGGSGQVYRIADRPPWDPEVEERSIRFGSPRGGRVSVPLAACPQWWGFDAGPLWFWTEDGAPAPEALVSWAIDETP
ncbi:MAG: hypothetical protein HQ481_04610 [Alphaproteobacteria bacterium]|nr:hypothetical protein [Alphaproteobacteria bacterium]